MNGGVVFAHGNGCWECGLGTSVLLVLLFGTPLALIIWFSVSGRRPDAPEVLPAESASPARMLRVRRLPTRVPFSQLYEIEFSSRGVEGTSLVRRVTRAPASLLTRHIGAGEAWASVREVDRKWEQGERGWVVELAYEPHAPQSE